MKAAAILMSHKLTDEQCAELSSRWSVTEIKSLPPDLQERWSNVPPDGPFPLAWILPILTWLEHETLPRDIVVIHGEPGCVYTAVTWCFRNERLPVYATTARFVEEHRQSDGSIVMRRVFRHYSFRPYPRL